MPYSKRGWESGLVPLSKTNLAAMDNAIYENAAAIDELKELEKNNVKSDLTIAGLELTNPITVDMLREAMLLNNFYFKSAKPTTATVGRRGDFWCDTSEEKIYLCVKVSASHSGNVYTWVDISEFINISDEMISKAISDYLKEHPELGAGADGKSAYRIALDNGFEGSEEEWLESLQGADGDKGDTGAQGPQGEKGVDGYTPVKGVDYYTEEDKAELESYIDEKLAEGNQSQEIFTDVLAEVGYTENSRVNSSGNVVSWDNSDVTGYIPVKAGDVIRLKDMYVPDTYNETGDSYGQTAYAYTSDKTFIKSVFLCTVNDASHKALDRVVENDGVVQFTVASEVFGENVAYIIIGAADITAESEVYVNSTFVKENDSGLPAYWLNELSTKAETIQQAMETAGRNKSAFLWYTDAHWLNNSQMSPELLKYLIENTPMNKVNFGGDIICDPTEFTHDNIKYAYEWRKLIAGLPNHHSVIGNHDANHNQTDVSKIAYSFLNAPEETADMIVGGDFYYYIDNPSEKTRYLYLSYLTNNHTEMMAQGQFIVDAIKSAPENWHIVAIAHRWFQYTSSSSPTVGSTPAYESEILKIFDEYNARTTHTASNYFTSQDFADGKAKVEFCIGGHIHIDYDFRTDGGIPVIITTSDTNQDRVPDSSVDSGTLGTISESAVYGIVADYDNSTIKVIGVGRGTSREISISV